MQMRYRGWIIHYRDQLEIETLVEEEFKHHQYYVELPTNTPLIIDAGAHIGTSTLYLHSLYPQARFICIEPDPANLELLAKNLQANDITQVEIIPKALVGANQGATTQLYTNHSFTVLSSLKSGGWKGEDRLMSVQVKTARLSELITETVDLLKLDIEGMETEVLLEAKDKLSFVKHLILEFHKTKTHSEEKVLNLLYEKFSEVSIVENHRQEKQRESKLLMIEASRTKATVR